MVPQLIKSSKTLTKVTSNEQGLSNELNINYNNSRLERRNNITTINIDRAVKGKGDVANTKTYTQNLVKKFELTGNKETCIRKIFIAERTDGLFDITVRELKVYYRKDKKHHFNKLLRFKSPNGNIEYVFELLKNQATQKHIATQPVYLLN